MSKAEHSTSLVVCLDEESKRSLTRAAELRKISVSDYVRTVMAPLAEREIATAEKDDISMTAEDQLDFWEALYAPVQLTEAQKNLGAMMRGG